MNKTKIQSRSRARTRTKKNIKNSSLQPSLQSSLKLKPSMSILSYNVSWESMTGNDKKWMLCNSNSNNNKNDSSSSRHNSVCVGNVANVFDTAAESLDFITLQESGEYKQLIKQSPTLQNMNYKTHKSGLDTICTFWNKKYNSQLLYSIKGEFEEGRPWMAVCFKKNAINNTTHTTYTLLCIVNVHMGHYTHTEEMEKLDKMMIEIKKYISKKNKDRPQVRYIISGDFNYDIKQFGEYHRNCNFKIDNTKFYYNPKNLLTCCLRRRRHNDHIIDSLAKPVSISIPDVEFMASDHKPKLGIIKS